MFIIHLILERSKLNSRQFVEASDPFWSAPCQAESWRWSRVGPPSSATAEVWLQGLLRSPFAFLAWAGPSPVFHTQEDELYWRSPASALTACATKKHPTPFLFCATLSTERLLTRSKNLSGKFSGHNVKCLILEGCCGILPSQKRQKEEGWEHSQAEVKWKVRGEWASWSLRPQPPPSPQCTWTTTATSRCILCVSEISK